MYVNAEGTCEAWLLLPKGSRQKRCVNADYFFTPASRCSIIGSGSTLAVREPSAKIDCPPPVRFNRAPWRLSRYPIERMVGKATTPASANNCHACPNATVHIQIGDDRQCGYVSCQKSQFPFLEIVMNLPPFVALARGFVFAFGALSFLAVATEGIAQTATPSTDKSGTKKAPPPAAAQPAAKDAMAPGMPGMGASGGMNESMMGMMKNMESMKMTGDTDRDFAMMMKMHHQGAIDMAEMQLKNGKDPKMRAMAKRIIEDQKKEIKEFDQWLAKRK